MIGDQLQKKLDLYEQLYFSLDDPVPFKGELKIYPILVKDYYSFYGCLNCLTMDKNTKYVPDGELGKMKKVSNPEGIAQSYLAYLISMMEDEQIGMQITQQVMQLFELIFHIKKGMYCPECHAEKSYEEIVEGMDEYIKSYVDEQVQMIMDNIAKEEAEGKVFESKEIPEPIMNQIRQKAQIEFFKERSKCECGGEMRDIFSIKRNGPFKTLVVRDVEINDSLFDELKAIVPRQNILDYDDDKYIDPDLKEELELKAQMQNKDYTSPTLEKQLICVSIGTGLTLEYLKNLPMRKLSMYLRTIDRKESYYAQYQASMSGMVTFKEDPKHWIFSDDKKNLAKELTSLDTFEKKFERVT